MQLTLAEFLQKYRFTEEQQQYIMKDMMTSDNEILKVPNMIAYDP